MALIVRAPRIRHVRRRTLESFKRSRRFMAWLEHHADRTEETIEDLFEMLKAGGAYAVERYKYTFSVLLNPFGGAELTAVPNAVYDRAVEVEAGAGFTAEAEVDPAEQGNEE